MLRNNSVAFFFSAMFLILSVSSAYALEDWFYSGDSFDLNGVTYFVTVDSQLTKVRISSNSYQLFIDYSDCALIDVYNVCVQQLSSSPSLRAYLLINRQSLDIQFNRSIDSLDAFPGQKYYYYIYFENNNSDSNSIFFIEQYPQSLSVSTQSPCFVRSNSVQFNGSIPGRSIRSCRIQLNTLQVGEHTVRGQLNSEYDSMSVSPLHINTSHPIVVLYNVSETFVSLNNGQNWTEYSLNISNLYPRKISMNISVDFTPLPIFLRWLPFTKSHSVLNLFTEIESNSSKDYVFRIARENSSQQFSNLRILYTVQNTNFNLFRFFDTVNFSKTNSDILCDGKFNLSSVNNLLLFNFNSSNGTSLSSNQGTEIIIYLNNTVVDKNISDVSIFVFKDDELYDFIEIPQLESCSRTRIPSIYVDGEFSNKTSSSYRFELSAHTEQINFNFSAFFTLSHSNIRPVNIEQDLPTTVYRGQTFLSSVRVSNSFGGLFQINVTDYVPNNLIVNGIHSRIITTNESDYTVYTYNITVPTNFSDNNFSITTIAEILPASLQGHANISSTILVIDPVIPLDISFIVPTEINRGMVENFYVTVVNENNFSLQNVTLFFIPSTTVHTSYRNYFIGELQAGASYSLPFSVRVFSNNESYSWNSSYARFTYNGNNYITNLTEIKLENIKQDENLMNGFNVSYSSIWNQTERIAIVDILFVNNDYQQYLLTIPYVDAYEISHSDTYLKIEQKSKKKITYKTAKYDRYAWENISYDYLDTSFFTGFHLPDIDTNVDNFISTTSIDESEQVMQEVIPVIVVGEIPEQEFSIIPIASSILVVLLLIGLFIFLKLRRKDSNSRQSV